MDGCYHGTVVGHIELQGKHRLAVLRDQWRKRFQIAGLLPIWPQFLMGYGLVLSRHGQSLPSDDGGLVRLGFNRCVAHEIAPFLFLMVPTACFVQLEVRILVPQLVTHQY
jgi:hypothetical protein